MEVNDYAENYGTGWIKIYRSISNHWLWKDKPFTKGQAWIDIIMECNHQENKVNIKNEIILCNRGESLNSLDTWAKRWGWNKSRVRRFIELLRNDSMIELKSTQQTTHLRVINYSIYNDNRNGKRNTDETQMTLNKNVKNEKKKDIYNGNNGKLTNPVAIKFQEYINKNYPRISKLKTQITDKQFKSITDSYEEKEVKFVLDSMENYSKLPTKYVSVGLTLQNWLKREYGHRAT